MGLPVGEMLHRMPASELTEWAALFAIKSAEAKQKK